jgi:hypothetical protein
MNKRAKTTSSDLADVPQPDAEAFHDMQRDLLKLADELIYIKAELADAHMMLRSNRIYIQHMERTLQKSGLWKPKTNQ